MPRAISMLSRGERSRVNPVAAQLWWLRPAQLVLLVIVPVYLSFLAFDYDKVVLRRYVPSADYAWGLALLIALALGAALVAGLRGSSDRGFASRCRNPEIVLCGATDKLRVPIVSRVLRRQRGRTPDIGRRARCDGISFARCLTRNRQVAISRANNVGVCSLACPGGIRR